MKFTAVKDLVWAQQISAATIQKVDVATEQTAGDPFLLSFITKDTKNCNSTEVFNFIGETQGLRPDFKMPKKRTCPKYMVCVSY